MSKSLYEISVKTIAGQSTPLLPYKGKVLLIVNVASKCGLTPQYEGLQKLYDDYKNKGFEVLGFPANNFLAQEPGNETEIQNFCSVNYQISFPLFSKISVKGHDLHPLYRYLTDHKPETDVGGPEFEADLAKYGEKRAQPKDILWNFEKFLISKNGSILARFSPDITAEHPELISRIEAALAALN